MMKKQKVGHTKSELKLSSVGDLLKAHVRIAERIANEVKSGRLEESDVILKLREKQHAIEVLLVEIEEEAGLVLAKVIW